jgi:hypothetical protein
MKIKILNYIVSIEKQSNSNSKTPFLENVVVSNENHNTEKTNNSNNMKNSIDTSNDLKIGRYVQKQMQILSDKNILSIKIINKLQDVSYCKNEFNITFSVLRDKKSGINDEKGYPRYYANDLYFNNFRLTSQWKKEHREFFIKWLNRHNSVKSPINEPKNYDIILPIELNPNNNEVFLETLLKTKSATITTFYKNGTKESKIWNAERMTANSNVIGNLRSRPEFRNGNWQKANIEKVLVEVINNSSSKPILKKSNKVISIKSNTMTKQEAIQLVNKKLGLKLNSNNTNWSNINADGIWSMEPNLDRKNRTLYLLLNNNSTNKLHAFEIPANHTVYEMLYVRDNKGVYRLVFNVNDSEYIEILKHINFKKFHKVSIDY